MLRSLNYGRVTSVALDPIEKKPLYHFHPGGAILSLGSFGCTLKCSFCQNWRISQAEPASEWWTPQRAAELALDAAEQHLSMAAVNMLRALWLSVNSRQVLEQPDGTVIIEHER